MTPASYDTHTVSHCIDRLRWGTQSLSCAMCHVIKIHTIIHTISIRDRRILLEKVAHSARKAVKLAEPYKPYGGQFLEFCSISLSTNQTCMKLTRKSTEFCHFFLPAESAGPYTLLPRVHNPRVCNCDLFSLGQPRGALPSLHHSAAVLALRKIKQRTFPLV